MNSGLTAAAARIRAEKERHGFARPLGAGCRCGWQGDGRWSDHVNLALARVAREDVAPVDPSDNSADSEGAESVTRLSVNMNAETAAALKKISDDRGVTVTEAVRRAVSVYKFMEDESRVGNVFNLKDADSGNIQILRLI